MAGLDILGGIGRGIMIGADQIRRQEAHDATLADQQQAQQYRDATLQMAQDRAKQDGELNALRTDAAKKLQEEQVRVDRLGVIQNELMQQYPDANDYQRQQLFVQKAVGENLFRGDELTKAHQTRDALRKRVGAQAYDAAISGDLKPLQMLLGEQGMAVDFTPDRKKLNIQTAKGSDTIDFNGLLQMDAMAGALEQQIARKQADQEFRAKEADITLKTEKAGTEDARQGYLGRMPQDRAPGASSGHGSKGSSSPKADGSGNPAQADPFDSYFKDRNAVQSFFQERYKDGVTFQGADGPVTLPQTEVASRVQRHTHALLGANGKLSLENAAAVAEDIALAESGKPLDKGVYNPTPILNPKTLQWETAIQTKDGAKLTYPKPLVRPTPEQVFAQELEVANRLVDSGESRRIAEFLKVPENLKKITQIFSDPDRRAEAEARDPTLARKIEILHAHNALGGVFIPEQGLSASLGEADRIRGPRPGMNGARDSDHKDSTPGLQLTTEEKRRAKELGAGPAVGVGDVLKAGFGAMGDAAGNVRDSFAEVFNRRAFDVAARAARATNFRVENPVRELARMLAENPSLQKEFSPDELVRIKAAVAGKN